MIAINSKFTIELKGKYLRNLEYLSHKSHNLRHRFSKWHFNSFFIIMLAVAVVTTSCAGVYVEQLFEVSHFKDEYLFTYNYHWLHNWLHNYSFWLPACSILTLSSSFNNMSIVTQSGCPGYVLYKHDFVVCHLHCLCHIWN